jgi:quercetin dioxygenase-like cupin family protein
MNQDRLTKGVGTCVLKGGGSSPYVKELKQRLSDLVVKNEEGHVEYLAGASGDALYKDEDVAVQMMFLKEGDQFPMHVHPVEKEWLIIIRGTARINVDGTERVIKARDELIIEPGQNHTGIALEDLWHIAISIPADEGYPDASN